MHSMRRYIVVLRLQLWCIVFEIWFSSLIEREYVIICLG